MAKVDLMRRWETKVTPNSVGDLRVSCFSADSRWWRDPPLFWKVNTVFCYLFLRSLLSTIQLATISTISSIPFLHFTNKEIRQFQTVHALDLYLIENQWAGEAMEKPLRKRRNSDCLHCFLSSPTERSEEHDLKHTIHTLHTNVFLPSPHASFTLSRY